MPSLRMSLTHTILTFSNTWSTIRRTALKPLKSTRPKPNPSHTQISEVPGDEHPNFSDKINSHHGGFRKQELEHHRKEKSSGSLSLPKRTPRHDFRSPIPGRRSRPPEYGENKYLGNSESDRAYSPNGELERDRD